MDEFEARPSVLREAAATLEGGITHSTPLRGMSPIPPGPAPTIAHDVNSAVTWWADRLATLVRQAEDAADALRSNADAYERMDQGVAERFAAGLTSAGADVTSRLGTRAP